MRITEFRILLRFGSALLALLLAACSGSGGNVPAKFGGGDDSSAACFAGSGKADVLAIMQYWYLWNDEADQFDKYRNIDLQAFSDAGSLLDYLRYRPLQFDRGFSYITTPEEEQAFFGEGEFVGFGFSMVLVGNEIYFSQVFGDSPAEVAGFQRGYRLLEINGRSIEQIFANEGLSEALGPAEEGFSLTCTVADVAGMVQPPVELSKAVVSIAPVPLFDFVQDSSGENAGYVLFNTFISSASEALRSAFNDLAETGGGVDRVVIDLRYNGGGLVSVSEVLASLLIGPGHESDIYSEMTFNSARAPEFNERTFFHTEANALALEKIIFITSEGSASASELVINGLKPYFGDADLALVGSTTYGKPVGQFAFDFCDEEFRLRAVTFKSVNADGEGDYFDGLPVRCGAADDLTHALGDPDEASLAAALEYMGSGNCPDAATAPGFQISGATPKARPITGPGLAQQFAGAF